MRDLALSSVSGYTDLDVESGQPVVVSGTELIRQRILVRLRRHRGEWVFDRRKGLLYHAGRSRRFDTAQFAAAVKAEIRDVPGVVRVVSVVTVKAGDTVTCTFRCEVRDTTAMNENAFVDIVFTATDANLGAGILLLAP